MTASLLLELKIGMTEITTLQERAHADLDMQLELQRELKTYPAQALEINKQLGALQDRALATNTHLTQLLPRGPLLERNNIQADHPGVSTETVQRTIRDLLATLTSEIVIKLEGPQTEFHTTLLSRLEGVLEILKSISVTLHASMPLRLYIEQ
jgi:hypothetical protein